MSKPVTLQPAGIKLSVVMMKMGNRNGTIVTQVVLCFIKIILFID